MVWKSGRTARTETRRIWIYKGLNRMRKPQCLTHTARFSRVSVNQTQAACSSFHQGEIRDAVKVTGSKPCSKQIDPCFRGRRGEKKQPTNETQVHWGDVTVQMLTPPPTSVWKMPEVQVSRAQLNTCNLDYTKRRAGRCSCHLQGLAGHPSELNPATSHQSGLLQVERVLWAQWGTARQGAGFQPCRCWAPEQSHQKWATSFRCRVAQYGGLKELMNRS